MINPAERMLWIDAPHFFAGAIWQRTATGWACVEAAPIIRWMIGKSASETADYLKRKGWRYGWI